MTLPADNTPHLVRPRYWGLALLLATCLALLLSAGYLYWQASQRQQVLVSTVRENLLWASMQLERETKRWSLFLAEATIESAYDLDELELRFEILYSRFITLDNGELKQLIEQDTRQTQLLAEFGAELMALEQDVYAYFSQPTEDFSRFSEQTDKLTALSNDFINQVITVRSENSTTSRNELLDTMFWLSVSVLLLISATMLLIFLLVRSLIKEQRQVTALSQMAQQLRETAEQAKAASKAKSAFVAMMSHEIRTPLNGILGMLNILTEEPLGNRALGYATAARESADHLQVIVSDILDMSSIETDKLTISSEPMSLTTLLEDLNTVARAAIKEKPIDFHLSMDAGLPDWIESDRVRLRQVIMNLLSNAFKFTDRGEVRLSAYWRSMPSTDNQGYLRIDVKDSGIGIEPHQQSLLFQGFTQLDSAINRRFGGTGLGLSICKELVTRMGGTIGLSSEPGEGSLFWFDIPVRCLQPTEESQPRYIAYYGFEDRDREQIILAAQHQRLATREVQPGEPMPEGCVAVVIRWQPPYDQHLNAMALWQQSLAIKPNFIAAVSADQTTSAYAFIKAGGQSLLVSPLVASQLSERLAQFDSA